MQKKINYNYAFVFYDVGEKRVQKVFKVCKKYLSHFQKSVFRGEMSPSKLMKLKAELEKVIDKREDFVCIIKLMNNSVFGEEVLGNGNMENGESLILWIFPGVMEENYRKSLKIWGISSVRAKSWKKGDALGKIWKKCWKIRDFEIY